MDAQPAAPGPLEGDAATLLSAELAWLGRVVEARIRAYCGEADAVFDWNALVPPDVSTSTSAYAQFLRGEECSAQERVVLGLAIAALVRPQALDVFLTKNANLDRPFTEFGGVLAAHGAFRPTVETALFVIAGDDLGERFAHYPLFDSDHPFFRHGVLSLEAEPGQSEFPHGKLIMAPEYVDAFTVGRVRCPPFGPSFPAKPLACPYEWEDLVLEPGVMAQVNELQAWLKHRRTLLQDWGLERRLGAGYRCLFEGPSGTGKTMTAALLGKDADNEVFRIDLSLVVSKYIGETEKNLENVFRHAENLDCILFFDEADALFGKRTGVDNAHDRYANQEVSFLLQRVEEYSGLVILATNLQANLDDAFMRRFQSVVHFPMPRPSERLRLWRGAFSAQTTLESRIQLDEIAQRFELSGGAILNVVRYCSLMALTRDSSEIRFGDLYEGARREYQKAGRSL